MEISFEQLNAFQAVAKTLSFSKRVKKYSGLNQR